MTSSGLLIVNKIPGPTSRRVVDDLVRRLRTRKVGHAGTLDPFAEGVLLLAWGRATALVPYLQEYPKTYEADAEFGRITDTQDRTGETVETRDASGVTRDAVEKALPRFRGDVLQVPPMFSAVRQDGERLYKLARRGETVEREARSRRVDDFALLSLEGAAARFRIQCEGGTYVRTLVHDLGGVVGPGACTTRLVRTAVGPHGLDRAVPSDRLGDLTDDDLAAARVSAADALPDWPELVIADPAEAKHVVCGSWRDPSGSAPRDGRFRITDATGRLLALAEAGDPPSLLRVFAGPEDLV